MEKQKKWQFILILAVIVLTLYNVFPTLFYYSKPLKSPINEIQAKEIANSIEKRVSTIESESKDWIKAYCDLLHLKPQEIKGDSQNWIVSFAKSDDAAKFRKFFPRAGSLIPFAPAQLTLISAEDNVKEAIVQRRIPTHLDQKYFSFAAKDSPRYREVMIDRAAQIAYALAGPSEPAYALSTMDPRYLETLAFQINTIAELESSDKSVANRFASSFTQGPFANRAAAIQALISAFDQVRDQLKKQPELEKKEALFISAENFLKKHEALFASGETPWSISDIKTSFSKTDTLRIANRNPLFSELSIDWPNQQIVLKLHPDVDPSKLKQPLINEAAKIARFTNESLTINGDSYSIALHTLADTSGFLVLNLVEIGKAQADSILNTLQSKWRPNHPDLQSLAIVDANTYASLPADQKALSLVVHAPSETNRSLSIVANGIDQILKTYQEYPDSELAQTFSRDFRTLAELLSQNGFQGYRGANQELLFERGDYCQSLLAATREEFQVKGTQSFALLELSNLEQRILAENKIDTKIHEDLMKWKDEYNSAQVSIQPGARYDVPKPTKSIFLSNLALSFTKYFRGDEKRVIHWGLDLSGGKTVQIELRDANNRLVKNEEDIKQGINELYRRVNKMGVSEVVIRQLGNNIVLDFPGSQSLSASELIKASSMYFHVVNEKFSSPSSPLASSTQRFLQEVWNEAIVTNRKDAQSINAIAYKHLHGETVSETARSLIENGLILQSPEDPAMGHSIEDSVSKIAVMRGEEWHGASQLHSRRVSVKLRPI
jgi:SecD/SecF fusion protein